MDFSTFVFFLLAGLLVTSSLLVVFLRNVVHCALALVSALLIIAVLFVTLHATGGRIDLEENGCGQHRSRGC